MGLFWPKQRAEVYFVINHAYKSALSLKIRVFENLPMEKPGFFLNADILIDWLLTAPQTYRFNEPTDRSFHRVARRDSKNGSIMHSFLFMRREAYSCSVSLPYFATSPCLILPRFLSTEPIPALTNFPCIFR